MLSSRDQTRGVIVVRGVGTYCLGRHKVLLGSNAAAAFARTN